MYIAPAVDVDSGDGCTAEGVEGTAGSLSGGVRQIKNADGILFIDADSRVDKIWAGDWQGRPE